MRTDTGVDELGRGRAFADLSRWRKVAVRGRDAMPWLNALVSADVSDLEPGRACRSLLLSATGGVRAEFTVALRPGEVLLLQDPEQQRPVDALLAPYVLSADVRLVERSAEIALLAFPVDPGDLPDLGPAETERSSPSCVGDGRGVDVLAPSAARDALITVLSRDHEPVDPDAIEAWRIAAGVPRVAAESVQGDLPDEIGLADAVAGDKGCYLGQEAVAKARNLGHPRRVLLHLTANGAVRSGDEVLGGESAVGSVTSATALNGRYVVLARVRWDARDLPLRTASGARLEPVKRPG